MNLTLKKKKKKKKKKIFKKLNLYFYKSIFFIKINK